MLMTGAISRGLTLQDFDRMTIGQIVDYCITYNGNNNVEKEEPQIRKATQSDWDNF